MPKAQLPLRSTCRWSTRCVLGYVAMEGACVTAARQQLLARVRVAVPLGGQTARDLGMTLQREPWSSFRLRLLPPTRSWLMTRERPLQELRAGAPGRCRRERLRRGQRSAVDAAGDIVVPVPHDACGEVATLVVGPRNVALVDKAILRAGYAVGMPITWPPPSSGGPLPPAVGSGAPVTTGGDWWVAAVLALAVVAGTAALAGARWRH